MTNPTPLKAIRRFDVFAEFSRQERQAKGYNVDEAKGYGIWVAKVVASRKFSKKDKEEDASGAKKSRPGPEPKFKSVGDELQTDEVFDLDIIERMGKDFYKEVLVPAIEKARGDGKSYEDIRDTIRADWKPAKR